jgi:phosphotransferase system enzyme I (PtsI)
MAGPPAVGKLRLDRLSAAHQSSSQSMPNPKEPEVVYEGIPASPGIAIAPVHVIARGFSAPEVYEINVSEVDSEQERFREAVAITKKQLLDLQSRLEDLSGENERGIFEAHLMMIEDRSVVNRVLTAIDTRKQNAEYAFYAVMQNFLEAMRRIPDPFLRERTADIEDVSQRVLRNFSPDEDHRSPAPEDRHILVAYDLAPSYTASMNRRHVLGFATEQGSVNSHPSILARAFGIPAVVGLEGAVIDVMALSPAIIDGYTGKLILHPTDATLSRYHKLSDAKALVRSKLDAKRGHRNHRRPPDRCIRQHRNRRGTPDGETQRRQGHRPLPHRIHAAQRR